MNHIPVPWHNIQKRIRLFTLIVLFIMTWIPQSNVVSSQSFELIVLAAPSIDDPYYADVSDDIFDFHIAYAQQIIEHGDRVLILTDDVYYEDYVAELGVDQVVVAPMGDIWMRDFTLSNVVDPIMFRYTPEGQGGNQAEADTVQETFATLITDAGITFSESDLLNDGGNFVDDYAGNVVISRKFLEDNNLDEDEAREQIRTVVDGIQNIAFIDTDALDYLGHADGTVSFVDENTLLVNAMPDNPEAMQQLRADLERGLPDVAIHEVITPFFESDVLDDTFGSACGLYTNALVTPNRIYFPQFGIPEDVIALEQVRAATTREVIPVSSETVCYMGGGVRCMSWQLRGTEAERLLEYVESSGF